MPLPRMRNRNRNRARHGREAVRHEPLLRLAALPGVDPRDLAARLHDPSADTSSLSFVSGALLGLVVGVLVALALAPQAGRHTRQHVWDTGIELRGRRGRAASAASAS